jgi:hypothetical protein
LLDDCWSIEGVPASAQDLKVSELRCHPPASLALAELSLGAAFDSAKMVAHFQGSSLSVLKIRSSSAAASGRDGCKSLLEFSAICKWRARMNMYEAVEET